MNTRQLQDELSLLLIRASLKGKYGMLDVAEANGITLMQALTLCLLEPGKPVPMNSLSNFLSCDPSNVTSIVDHLVACSLIERKESVKDRRIKNITLTERGLNLRSTLLELAAKKRLPNIAQLSVDDIKELIRLLNKATNIEPIA